MVARLRGHPACARLTARAVSSHLDYLADEKLRIDMPGDAGRADRRNGKREAVVGIALKFGIVREEHLALLPRPEAAEPGR